MFWFIAVALVLSHAAALGAGGFLHYRFGKAVLATVAVLKNLPK